MKAMIGLMHVIRRVLAVAVAVVLFAAWAVPAVSGEFVVVADTRVVESAILRYFADLYNINPFMNAVWAVVLTALYGSFLGILMDFILSRTGLDLSSRPSDER
ncbi:DVU0150 family protein [Desulfovibrio psychrotolerans]|uniref:Uncharacterized protein n=1 Tax=Desulfovibrio psychrotolerans TaxID=415242 RepID=A0A7J0BV15_9BACT|nr:DVU0150 family protein [Desulfovibrio psychrotolerans]GFM37032.1 hypothetical protein DSM19430T_17160 [Desulfovibrio psychrotolerans]